MIKAEAEKTKKKIVEIPVYKKDGRESGKVTLHPEVFQAPVNRRLLDIVFTAYAAHQRRGTADTKERNEVRGGGKKPWRQKGTGRARHGSRRSPIWRGGGTTFGPHPRDYSVRIPKRWIPKALASALSLKVREDNLLVVEETDLSGPKTKELVEILKALKLDKTRTLYVVAEMDEKLKRASRNLRELFFPKEVRDLNAYHVLRRKKILFEKEALPLVERRILGSGSQ